MNTEYEKLKEFIYLDNLKEVNQETGIKPHFSRHEESLKFNVKLPV